MGAHTYRHCLEVTAVKQIRLISLPTPAACSFFSTAIPTTISMAFVPSSQLQIASTIAHQMDFASITLVCALAIGVALIAARKHAIAAMRMGGDFVIRTDVNV